MRPVITRDTAAAGGAGIPALASSGSDRRCGHPAFARWSEAAVTGLLRAYQLAVSPWLPPACRYSPTCSQYAVEAVARYGAVRGLWMAAQRLARCHPFHPGGYDPVR